MTIAKSLLQGYVDEEYRQITNVPVTFIIVRLTIPPNIISLEFQNKFHLFLFINRHRLYIKSLCENVLKSQVYMIFLTINFMARTKI